MRSFGGRLSRMVSGDLKNAGKGFGEKSPFKWMHDKSKKSETAAEEEEASVLESRRESMFAPREVENQVMLDDAAIEEGIDVLKKRRGSIFGNDSGTMFGN